MEAIFAQYLTLLVNQDQYAAQSANNNRWSMLYQDFARVVLEKYHPSMKLEKKSDFAVQIAKPRQWLMFIMLNVHVEQDQISMSLMKRRAFVV